MNSIEAGGLALPPVLEDDPARLLVPRCDYARRPVPEAFENLDEVLAPLLREHGNSNVYDVTGYYSKRKDNLTAESQAALLRYNRAAFSAAVKAGRGALIIYFQGELMKDTPVAEPNPSLGFEFTPNCMSCCVWESFGDSQTGSDTPAHRAAVEQAGEWYDHFAIKKYTAVVDGDKVNFQEYSKL